MKGLIIGGLALAAAVATVAAVTGRVVSDAIKGDPAHRKS